MIILLGYNKTDYISSLQTFFISMKVVISCLLIFLLPMNTFSENLFKIKWHFPSICYYVDFRLPFAKKLWHIYCIDIVSPHCDLRYVGQEDLYVKRHYHNDYIDMAFPQCVFPMRWSIMNIFLKA